MRYLIPSRPSETGDGGTLGRHINHDERSKSYAVSPSRAARKSVKWLRTLPILDQGDLGKCTCETGAGVLGTMPFYRTLPISVQNALSDTWATDLYREVTAADPYPGQWEPTDTGSDGLSVAKVLKSRGLISGYTHAFNIDQVFDAIAQGPIMLGMDWYDSFDKPDNGVVSITPGAKARGGHEIEGLEYDALNDLFIFANSWGPGWGKEGYFAMSTKTLTAQLANQGDVTSLVPLSEPAPVPTPITPNVADIALAGSLPPKWLTSTHTLDNKKAAQAVSVWKRSLGL